MTKEKIIEEIKEIVVTEYGKDPEDRSWYGALGALIDKIEASIKEENDA